MTTSSCHLCVIMYCSGQGREDGKTSKSRKPSASESAEKSSRRKEGSKMVENRLIQMSMTTPQGGDAADGKDLARRKTEVEHSSASSRGKRHVKDDTEKVSLSPLLADDSGSKDRRKTAAEPKEKSSSAKLQRKTKDSMGSEKDKNRQQRGRKTAQVGGRKKPRTESTSSASSDSSSSTSSTSSGSSSSGSTSSTDSSSSAASSRKKQRKRTAAKSKSDAQQTTARSSKTHRAKDATKSTDKLESGKPQSKDLSRRPREKSDDDGQREQSFRGGTWKDDNGDERRMTADGRKDGRQQRSGREKKQTEVSSPPRRSRDEEFETHGTPGSDRRLQDSSVDYRPDRMSARYSGDHRRSGRYDEHYDRPQHPAEFEVTDRYRTGQHCGCRCCSCCSCFSCSCIVIMSFL